MLSGFGLVIAKGIMGFGLPIAWGLWELWQLRRDAQRTGAAKGEQG